MSYIKIDDGFLFKEKPAALKFNQYAIQVFLQKINFTNYAEASEIYAMFYGGLCGNCAAKEIEIDFTFEEVQDWVDKLYLTKGGKEVIKKVNDVIVEVENYKVMIADLKEKLRTVLVKEETNKKKVAKK